MAVSEVSGESEVELLRRLNLQWELGPRVTDHMVAEIRAVRQRGAEGLATLIAKRIRAFNIKNRVKGYV